MIDEELLGKFDRIQDISVSEEMLDAYLEGNLDAVGSFHTANIISANERVSSLIEESISANCGDFNFSFDAIAENLLSNDSDYLSEIPALEKLPVLSDKQPNTQLPTIEVPSLLETELQSGIKLNSEFDAHIENNST